MMSHSQIYMGKVYWEVWKLYGQDFEFASINITREKGQRIFVALQLLT